MQKHIFIFLTFTVLGLTCIWMPVFLNGAQQIPAERQGTLQTSITRLEAARNELKQEIISLRQERKNLQQEIETLKEETNTVITFRITVSPNAKIKLENP